MKSYNDCYVKNKRCKKCGCIIGDDSDSDICECCLDDMREEDNY